MGVSFTLPNFIFVPCPLVEEVQNHFGKKLNATNSDSKIKFASYQE